MATKKGAQKKVSRKRKPTARKMREFADQFNRCEWEVLTNNQEFLDTFPYDLNKAETCAKQILVEGFGNI